MAGDKRLSVKDFVKQYSGAPVDGEELAQAAAKVRGKLGEKAQALLDAQAAFDTELERLGFEHG